MADGRESLFPDELRARAQEVLGDTDAWTCGDWQRAAIHLASAVVAAAGDLDKVQRPDGLPADAVRPLPYDGPPVPVPDSASPGSRVGGNAA